MGISCDRERYIEAVKKTGAIVRQIKYLVRVSLFF